MYRVSQNFPNDDNGVCKADSREMAFVLQDKNTNIVKSDITRSFCNRIRSGLLYLKAKLYFVYQCILLV